MAVSKIDDKLAITTIRVLAASAITKAKSGHPGIALGAAPIMYELFAHQMNCSPTYHKYYNRDRFVLSAGHASSLLYATMLVCGYNNITMEDLKNFRQIDSKTPGHPEPALLDNVEVSSGPLGQGIAMAVGMAIASKKAAQLFNSHSVKLIDNYVYCLFGDGCFEEGICNESLAIAGRLKLNNLIMLYDYNEIQLDGKVSDSTDIEIVRYFKSLGWNVLIVPDVEELKSLKLAFNKAKNPLNKRPTVILCRSILGFGSCNANSNKAHGTPLTEEQLADLKKNLRFTYPNFTIPETLSTLPRYVNNRVEPKIIDFNKKLEKLERTNISLYNIITNVALANKIDISLDWFDQKTFPEKESTRKIAGQILQIVAKNNSNLICSIADLSASTMMGIKDSNKITSKDWTGQNLDCGVREFAMAAINNGIVAYGGLKALGSTFMSFSDYNKAAIRLAAISQIPTINFYSHDSISVGEDGPTHQPIEQLWSLRLIPNHYVFRPTSYMDMIVAFETALKSTKTPTSIITSRSAFKQINVTYDMARHGAYVVKDVPNHEITLYATGSEIEVAMEVAKLLSKPTRVVAINSIELLMQQDELYIKSIFDNSKKVSIEFGVTTPWYRYVDLAIGVDQFGYSGKPNDIIRKLGLENYQIVEKINMWLKGE